jgi:hypothetical protein
MLEVGMDAGRIIEWRYRRVTLGERPGGKSAAGVCREVTRFSSGVPRFSRLIPE